MVKMIRNIPVPQVCDTQFEFFKLDEIDRRVTSWVHKHDPTVLLQFLEFTAAEYRVKGIGLNVLKIYCELTQGQVAKIATYS